MCIVNTFVSVRVHCLFERATVDRNRFTFLPILWRGSVESGCKLGFIGC